MPCNIWLTATYPITNEMFYFQDSLHRGIHNPYQHLMVGTSSLSPSQAQAAQAAAKKKGVKSTLGRIFGKKDKHLKSMKDPYVTMPLSNSPSGGFAPPQHSNQVKTGLG